MAFQFPLGYTPLLDIKQTLHAMNVIERSLLEHLEQKFGLTSVDPPLIVGRQSGLNDDFRVSQRLVDFDTQPTGEIGELLNTAIKWRRFALMYYNFDKKQGIISKHFCLKRDSNDLIFNALATKEIGFDIVIDENLCSLETLEKYAVEVVGVISKIELMLNKLFPQLRLKAIDQVKWISMEKLRSEMRLSTAEERINKVTRDNGVVILYDLENEIITGQIFDDESQDVYDWELYARVYFYNYAQEKNNEIIRIGMTPNKAKLAEQNLITKENNKTKTNYDAALTHNDLPMTVSCTIDLSLLSMYLLEKQHIGEVIRSLWDRSLLDFGNANNIPFIK